MNHLGGSISAFLVVATWSTAAFAARAGVGETCGGLAAIQCKSGLFCDFGSSCGYADQGGKCKKKPTVCPASSLTTTVCGCDGYGYPTKCAAEKAGVSIRSSAPCPGTGAAVGKPCGGMAMIKCKEGLFCDLGSSCGYNDRGGKCKKKPTVCPASSLTTAACGCDGHGYPTKCAAEKAGVSVRSSGPCGGAEGASCGSRGLAPCASGLYCKFNSGCGANDSGGKCTKKPTVCPASSLTTSVCGCDGYGYPTSCAAARAGTSIKGNPPCR